MRNLLFVIIILVNVRPAYSQNEATCPAVIDQAVAFAAEVCQPTGRNQACYGNLRLTAEPQPDAADFTFEQPGDIADVIDIAALTLDPFDAEARSWGVALMKLQANLPDTLPGQNVTVLLFGDVEIANAVTEPTPTLGVTASNNLNVRGGPGTDYAVISGLQSGQSVAADGRLEDNSWLRIQLLDGRVGWVFGQLVTAQGDLTALTVRSSDDTLPVFRPMQAFYFRSGLGSAACAGRIDSGMLIQTPGGTREIILSINKVDIRLASTLFFQTTPENKLVISALKGKAQVTAQGVERTVAVGSQVVIPLDENLAASAPPGEVQPISDPSVGTLPFGLLPFEVDMSQVITAAETPGAPPVEATPEATPQAESTPPVGGGSGGTVTVPGSSVWFDSGISVAAGQTFTMTVSGAVNVWPDCESGRDQLGSGIAPCSEFYSVGSEGILGIVREDSVVQANNWVSLYPAPDARLFALVGRIGESGRVFTVGRGGVFTAETSGTLQFAVNDHGPADNIGEYIVTVVVQ